MLRGGGIDFTAGEKRMTLHLPPDLGSVRAITASDDRTFGWAAPRYGELAPVSSIIAEARVRLPWRGISTIRANP